MEPFGTTTASTNVDCERARAVWSAELDNELVPDDETRHASAHRGRCAHCRRWSDAAIRAHRLTRVGVVETVPDLTRPIMAAIARSDRARPLPATRSARLALGIVAMAQLVAAMTHLATGSETDTGAHSAREQGAFELALAIGFLVAATRPRLAHGIAVTSVALAMALLATSAIDVVGGRTSVAVEVHHAVAIAGAALTTMLGGVRLRNEPT